MQNIPIASSSIDSNNLVLVMNGNNPTTTNNNNSSNNNNQTNHPQQPIFINPSQSFLPKQQNHSVPQQPVIFFQNHLVPQTSNVQHSHPIVMNNNNNNNNTGTNNSTSSTPMPSNMSNSGGDNAVDVENFAKFQHEQAKQFSFFQQQQAAAFLQLAIQQKQMEVAQFASAMNMSLPNGFLIPNTSTATNFQAPMGMNSQPIFIPNAVHNTTFDQHSPMSESILSSSPSSNALSHHHLISSSADSIDTESTSASVSDKSQVLLSNQRRTGPVRRSRKGGWSEEEDEMLRAAVQTYGGKNWKKIAETLQNRTSVQCLHRWQKVLNPNLVKGPWTKDEDDRILQLVKTYGPENWSMIASHLPGRIGKQCRERWYNHLDPSIKKEPWTEEEENLLLDAQNRLGNKWAEISKLIVGRTDNACKNHFNSLIAREKKKDTTVKEVKVTTETTRKPKKITKKEDSAVSRARHKRSISDTAFYQNYQYEARESGPTLSPMAHSNNSNGSGGNSPNANNLHHANTSNQQQHPNFFSSMVPPPLFPFNSNQMMMQNPNLMQQNVIPIFRQKPASQSAFTQNAIPNIDISSPNSLGLSTPTDLFHDLSAFEAINPSNTNGNVEELTNLVDVQDTLINQVGSGLMTNFDVFETHDSEVLIHEDSNEEMNMSTTPGTKNRPSTVFNEDMDFNEFGESDLNTFLDEDNTDQINSGLFPIPFADRETKRKKFNHVFHNR